MSVKNSSSEDWKKWERNYWKMEGEDDLTKDWSSLEIPKDEPFVGESKQHWTDSIPRIGGILGFFFKSSPKGSSNQEALQSALITRDLDPREIKFSEVQVAQLQKERQTLVTELKDWQSQLDYNKRQGNEVEKKTFLETGQSLLQKIKILNKKLFHGQLIGQIIPIDVEDFAKHLEKLSVYQQGQALKEENFQTRSFHRRQGF